MTRNDRGFTLIEIVVVMVLISIIAAATFSRSITTDQINLVGQADKIRQHIRYAQSLAMKRDEIWGIKCDNGKYWLFKWETLWDDDIAINLPGEAIDQIILSDLGILMNEYTLFFKKFGVPYKAISTKIETSNGLNINISAIADGSLIQTLAITPETGLIDPQ